MKRFFFIGIVFLFIANSINGQLSLEAIAGAQITWQANKVEEPSNRFIQGILNDQYDGVYKPFIGLQMKYKTNRFLDVNFEIQYSVKGQKVESVDYKESLHYLKYIQSFDLNIYKGLKLGAGIFWGYKLKSEFYGFGPQTSFGREDWDTGGLISTSYKMKRFVIRAAYYYSFSTLYNINYINSQGEFIDRVNKKNRAIQIGIGYSLRGHLPKSAPKSLL